MDPLSKRRACLFCGTTEGKITREHLWSDWMNDLFIPVDGVNFRVENHQKKTVKIWKSKNLDLQAGTVCSLCNGSWMSNLETRHAKPVIGSMIRNISTRSILPSGIKSISVFAFKTAVIADAMSRPDSFYSVKDRESFKKSLRIPGNVDIWISRFKVDRGWHGSVIPRYILPMNGSSLDGFELYSLTYIAGNVLLQVLSSRWIKNTRRNVRYPHFIHNPSWDSFSHQCWPIPLNPIVWPPPTPIERDSFGSFCDRWNRLRLTI